MREGILSYRIHIFYSLLAYLMKEKHVFLEIVMKWR